jgi:hypothetical protein
MPGGGTSLFTVTNLLLRAQIALERPTFVRELLADEQAQVNEIISDGGTIEEAGEYWSEILSNDGRHELDALYRERVAAVLGLCEGLERFCESLRVEPANLLAIEPSSLPVWHSAGRLRGEGIASDPMAEAVYKHLAGVWSRMLIDHELPGVH